MPAKRLRICMVATRHTLDDARVIHREATSLTNANHEVILLFTCDGNWSYRRHDKTVLATGSAPDGAAEYNGFHVRGLPRRRGIRGKWRTFRNSAALAARLEADVYHAHEPDLALAIALRAKKLTNRRNRRALVVHDMHEYPPGETVDNTVPWLRPTTHLALVGLDWWFARGVDHVFTANSVVRGYALTLNRRAAADVLYNGPPLRLFPQAPPRQWDGVEPLVLVHEGALSFDRGLREMVEAVDALRDRVRLRIVGDVFGDERAWLDSELGRRGLEGIITRTGWLPYAEVGAAVRQGHVGLVLFRECLENVMAGPPNKLFNYMNAGLPVLSVGFPELRRIVGEERCGIIVADQTVGAAVSAIRQLLDGGPAGLTAMSLAGQRAIRERYSWEQMERVMLATYDELERRLRS